MRYRKAITKMQAVIVIAVIIVAAILAGYYYYVSMPPPAPPTPTPTPTPTPKVTEITLMFEDWEFWGPLIERFEAAHPDIKVKYLPTDYAVLNDKMMADYVSGEEFALYDIVHIGGYNLPKFASIGYLMPLDDFLPKEQMDKFMPEVLETDFYYYGPDGKRHLYGVPTWIGPQLWAINTEMFKEAGLDPEKPPKTYDEVIEYARIIKEKTGHYGVVYDLADDNMWFEFVQHLFAFGGKMYDEETGVPVFNSTEGVNALTYFRTLYEEELMNPDAIVVYSSGTKIREFITETGAMTTAYAPLTWAWANNPEKSTIVDKCRLFLNPGEVLTSATMSLNEGFGIPQKIRPERIPAVKEFIQYVLFNMDEVKWLLYEGGVQGPVPLKAIWEDPTIKDKIPWWDTYKEQYGYYRTMEHRPWFRELIVVLNSVVKQGITGALPVKEALDTGVASLVRIMIEYYGFEMP